MSLYNLFQDFVQEPIPTCEIYSISLEGECDREYHTALAREQRCFLRYQLEAFEKESESDIRVLQANIVACEKGIENDSLQLLLLEISENGGESRVEKTDITQVLETHELVENAVLVQREEKTKKEKEQKYDSWDFMAKNTYNNVNVSKSFEDPLERFYAQWLEIHVASKWNLVSTMFAMVGGQGAINDIKRTLPIKVQGSLVEKKPFSSSDKKKAQKFVQAKPSLIKTHLEKLETKLEELKRLQKLDTTQKSFLENIHLLHPDIKWSAQNLEDVAKDICEYPNKDRAIFCKSHFVQDGIIYARHSQRQDVEYQTNICLETSSNQELKTYVSNLIETLYGHCKEHDEWSLNVQWDANASEEHKKRLFLKHYMIWQTFPKKK